MGIGGIALVALFALIVVAMLLVLRQDGQFLIRLPGVKFRSNDTKSKITTPKADFSDIQKLKLEGNLVSKTALEKSQNKR